MTTSTGRRRLSLVAALLATIAVCAAAFATTPPHSRSAATSTRARVWELGGKLSLAALRVPSMLPGPPRPPANSAIPGPPNSNSEIGTPAGATSPTARAGSEAMRQSDSSPNNNVFDWRRRLVYW